MCQTHHAPWPKVACPPEGQVHGLPIATAAALQFHAEGLLLNDVLLEATQHHVLPTAAMTT